MLVALFNIAANWWDQEAEIYWKYVQSTKGFLLDNGLGREDWNVNHNKFYCLFHCFSIKVSIWFSKYGTKNKILKAALVIKHLLHFSLTYVVYI